MMKNFVERLLTMPYLMETPGDQGAGGGGNGDGKSGADNGGNHKPDAADGNRQESKGNPDAGGNRKPADDPRIAGLMADLKKERAARQKFETDHKTTAAELERERIRVRALSGLEVTTPEEADEKLIRERLERLYPWLKDLTQEDIQAIKEGRGQSQEIRDAITQQWKSHADRVLDSLLETAGKALGGKLSDRQAKRIQQAYVEEARTNPEFLRRHEAGDPKLIVEFVKEWTEDFVEPGRRSALATETAGNRRPRVPGGKDRSVVGTGGKQIDVTDDKAVGDMLVAGFKDRGGQFGRR